MSQANPTPAAPQPAPQPPPSPALTNPQPNSDDPSHALRCMEVWGGHSAVDTRLSLPGIDAWVFSQPYRDAPLGGDIHYISSCFTGRVARLVLADVSGHGDEASQMARTLRALMRKHIHFLDQSDIARTLNRDFARLGEAGRFATALLLSYFAPSDQLLICNAGHPPPLWWHANSPHNPRDWHVLDHQSPHRTDAPNNLPLGIIDPTDYVQFAVRLDPGDLVLLYTDSLLEARPDPDQPDLGLQGLLDLARATTKPQDPHDPRATGLALLQAVEQHRRGAPPEDDTTLIVLSHNAANPRIHPLRQAIRSLAGLLGLAGD